MMYKKGLLTVRNIILALCSTMAIGYYFLYSTGNILNIIVFVVCLSLYTKYGFSSIKERLSMCSFLGGGIVALVLTAGRLGRTNETILDALSRYKETVIKDEYVSMISMTGYSDWRQSVVLGIMFSGLWIVNWFLIAQFMKHIKTKGDKEQFHNNSISENKLFWAMVIVLILCWIPYFIINYPGVLTYDSIYQFSQAVGDSALNSKHPVMHTALIAICRQIGIIVAGSNTVGVAIYSIIQMSILSLIYSYMIKTLFEYGVNLKWCILILLFFALIPFNAMYAITMWKDILFAGFVLWFSTILFRMFICEDLRRCMWVILAVSGYLMISFRTNGLIAFIMCCPFLLILVKNYRKKLCVILAIPIMLNCIITGPIYNSLGVERDNIVEMLSIPLQHISRVVVDCEEKLSDSQIERIEKFAPLQEIKNTYNCRFADPIKILMWSYGSESIIAESKWDFVSLWIELGLEYPMEYFLAEIDATLGYWYSDIQYNVVEFGVYPNDYGILGRFDLQVEAWQKLYNWCNLYRSIPLLGSLYNMGTVFMIIVLIMIVQIYLRQRRSLIVSIPVIMVWCTIMVAAPLHSEMRYVYSMMVSAPLILGNAILHIQWDKEN